MTQLTRAVPGALLVAFITAGCASSGGSPSGVTEPARPLMLETLKLVMEQGTNDDSPARVDLVRTRDAKLIDQLLAIETKAWFAGKRDDFKNARPDALFDEWEPVPGVVVGPQQLAVDVAVAGVLFCGVNNGGAPLRLERDGDVAVHIGDDGCEIRGGSPSKEPGVLDNLKNLLSW